MSDVAKDMEILALRSQLAITQENIHNHKIPKPRFNHAFRQLWVLLSKVLPAWQSALVFVKPETVIGWHRSTFKRFWTIKSRKPGRPKISASTIALIRRIHNENPLLSPEKIHERLVDLAIKNIPAPNTIAKYIPHIRKPPTEKQTQSWQTFLKNHSKDIWAMDFYVVPTINFKVLYVLLIVNHHRRKIEHFAITANPTSKWVAQQIREATPFGAAPEYLIHDNDCIFASKQFQNFLTNAQIKSKRTSIHSPWQNGICERLVGIIRRELFDHIIPFNQSHLERLLREYIHNYYNAVRTHQGIGCQTPIEKDAPPQTSVADTVLTSKPILGGLYSNYSKAA
jgi:transposase InsO family protein